MSIPYSLKEARATLTNPTLDPYMREMVSFLLAEISNLEDKARKWDAYVFKQTEGCYGGSCDDRTIADAIREEEIEACAKTCEEVFGYDEYDPGGSYAALIRSRKQELLQIL